MSRIGRMPIAIPAGVTLKIDGNLVTVKGPKGELSRAIHSDMILELENDTLLVKRPSDAKEHRSLHGLTRTLIANMVTGVTTGFTKTLEIAGVGYRAAKSGTKLALTLGFSHPVEVEPPKGLSIDVPAPNRIIVSGSDKEAVGALAAKIRGYREPEPYKGKGIKYEGEVIRRKVGKAGGKGKK
ncbi:MULTISPECIES: 50S ribosomal protein L6 [Propionispora]|jgi:large subunit ribosomal protein L6|uniref:Large ribosomal subunit protein uL6 n=2 Tax=Propionispora TaxID=112902 RepID=A0A1H8WF95_9FIRM|nr:MULTISPECIES: 50S ribosomal protein L6 [Propionispora]SEP26296.1 large subunit ribosomal protein L6 [Propionispora vibrioides]SHJ83678.1 large subunit ribosomal protein L6 [Propionispora hippei DSM 15287]